MHSAEKSMTIILHNIFFEIDLIKNLSEYEIKHILENYHIITIKHMRYSKF